MRVSRDLDLTTATLAELIDVYEEYTRRARAATHNVARGMAFAGQSRVRAEVGRRGLRLIRPRADLPVVVVTPAQYERMLEATDV